ncbi:Cytochrome C assembly protein [Pyrodictium delaneyi]|uniref:Cytochrome C assembly protein n=1 Tax=Pyrodictium delaneyi TaxID=1273541 RepID=A0A0P0N2K6_9CREN|nr:cytochrome c biogenesis protein CcsA [Pyrodictium delaneyi]ALL00540.1 Cytochrome C assembly protein [Pyrodictium delaneyi]OWJ54003.1 hypothetical protein Pdsh_09010 [Pyrodictium delaneyi]
MVKRGLEKTIVPLLLVLSAIDALLVVYAAFRAPYPLRVNLGSPTAYLNIYIHIPMAWGSYLLYTLAFITAIAYLVRGSEKLDAYIQAFIATATAYAIFTLVSGMAWASESWGSAWSWDPRETGVLLLLLAYLLYFVLRSSIPDPDRASRLSAAYAVAAYSMVPVSFLAPRLVASSLHPTMEQFGNFMAQPEVIRIFVTRIVMASLIAILLAYIMAKRYENAKPLHVGILRYAGIVFVIAGIVVGLIMVYPYLSGGVERVVDAKLANGEVVALMLSKSGYVELSKPLTVPIVEGEPAIIGHLVKIRDSSVEIVIHWSVALNVAAYLMLLGVLMLYASRSRGRGV